MSSIRTQRLFFRRVGEALAPYQLIEALLKLYVERAHLKIERLLALRVPFHYPRSEYENAPLDRLITLFQRHSNNKQLITRLRGATKARNYIAHRVIEDYMDHHEKDPKQARVISRQLKKAENDGYDLVEDFFKELRTFHNLDDFVREVLDKRRTI
jgi:hypothetical protein